MLVYPWKLHGLKQARNFHGGNREANIAYKALHGVNSVVAATMQNVL